MKPFELVCFPSLLNSNSRINTEPINVTIPIVFKKRNSEGQKRRDTPMQMNIAQKAIKIRSKYLFSLVYVETAVGVKAIRATMHIKK